MTEGDVVTPKKLNEQIDQQVINAIILLGGKSDIIGTLASRGDTLTDEEVLASLKAWNAATTKEVEDRLVVKQYK